MVQTIKQMVQEILTGFTTQGTDGGYGAGPGTSYPQAGGGGGGAGQAAVHISRRRSAYGGDGSH